MTGSTSGSLADLTESPFGQARLRGKGMAKDDELGLKQALVCRGHAMKPDPGNGISESFAGGHSVKNGLDSGEL